MKEINEQEIRNVVSQLFQEREKSSERRIKIYTGAGGYDLFTESVEEHLGYKRFYLPNKIARIFKKKARRSVTGRNYRLFKIK